MIRHTLQGYYSSKVYCSQVDRKKCLQNFDQNSIHKLYPIVHYSIPLQLPHWSIDLVEAVIDHNQGKGIKDVSIKLCQYYKEVQYLIVIVVTLCIYAGCMQL